jgi:uncharacterized membrane protein
MPPFSDLGEKIRTLESERSLLKNELENIRKVAEVKAAILEKEVEEMHVQLQMLREILAEQHKVPKAQPVPSSEPFSIKPPQIVAVVQPKTEVKVSQVVQPKAESYTNPSGLPQTKPKSLRTVDDPVLKLTEDERIVVEILLAHGGMYSQRSIRNDAVLSWLETNRALSRLSERGLIRIDKNEGLENVVLMGQISQLPQS